MPRPTLPLCALLLSCATSSKPGDDGRDGDGDGWSAPEDCEDGSTAIHPEADEVCDGLDNDCDGEVDEDPVDGVVGWPDADGDGYGAEGEELASCAAIESYIAVGGDCDDDDAQIHPEVEEVCDGLDNDCDGLEDEGPQDELESWPDADGDGYGEDIEAGPGCRVAEGWVAAGGDCDDANPLAWPGAEELCGPDDEDCDPNTEGTSGAYVRYADGSAADMTEAFAAGDSISPVEITVTDGSWYICEGVWYVSLVVQGSVTLTGASRFDTVLDSGNRRSVIEARGEGTLHIESMSVYNGNGHVESSMGYQAGGGIACVGYDLTVRDTYFTYNYGDIGGAIYAERCTADISDSVFWRNTAGYGGGLGVLDSTVTLSGSEIYGNGAELGGGGVFLSTDRSDTRVLLQDTTLSANVAYWGAGLALYGGAEATCAGSSEVEAGFFSGEADEGGGVYIDDNATSDAAFQASACDFGQASEANLPEDIYLNLGSAYADLGLDVDLICSALACE